MNDPFRHADSIEENSLTDKTCFYTPFNQSIMSKSYASNEKLNKDQGKDTARHKVTPETLKAICKTENLNQVTELNLDGNSRQLKNRLKSISGLHSLINLKELNLSNNDIEKIENLNSLKALHVLNLSCNKITKLENISVLKNLEILNLSNNLIEEIPPIIVKNTNLIEINFSNNLISDKTSITNLKNLNRLAKLFLNNNPVTEIPGYPGFVFQPLKKLVNLDGKPTPAFLKSQNISSQSSNNPSQQPSITLADIPARSPKTFEDSMHEYYPQLVATQNSNLTKVSYQQRLLATQNRLAELNSLNNQISFLTGCEETKKNVLEIGNLIGENSLEGSYKFQEDTTPNSENQGRISQEGFGQFNGRSEENKFHDQERPEKKEERIASKHLRRGSKNMLPSLENITTLVQSSPKNNLTGVHINFAPDENSLVSFSESGLDIKRHFRDSDLGQTTVSPKNVAVKPTTTGFTEYTDSYMNIPQQMAPLGEVNNNLIQDNWSGGAKLSGNMKQHRSNIWSIASLNDIMSQNDQNNDNKSIEAVTGLKERFSFENIAEVQKEKEFTERNNYELEDKIAATRSEINQRFTYYDQLWNIINAKKFRQKILEIISNLGEIVQVETHRSGRTSIRDQENIAHLKERSELLSKIKSFLELVDSQTEHHLNYFLLWNQVNFKVEGKETKDLTLNGRISTIESVDSMFSFLSKQIDDIWVKLELVKEQINIIRDKNQYIGVLNQLNAFDAHLKSLLQRFDDFVKDSNKRADAFYSLKDLYINLFKLSKAQTDPTINEIPLEMAAEPIEKCLSRDVSPTSPKNSRYIKNEPSPRPFVAGNYNSSSQQKNQENLSSKKANRHSLTMQGSNNTSKEEDYIALRAFKSLNKGENINVQGPKSNGKSPNKMGPSVQLSKSPSKIQSSPQEVYKRRQMVDDDGVQKENQPSTAKTKNNRENEDFVFHTLLENEDHTPQKGVSPFNSSPRHFSSASKMKRKKNYGASAENIKNLIYKTSPQHGFRRLESLENERVCQYCIAKDNIVKLTQEEMFKAHQEKAAYEMEIRRLHGEIERVKKEEVMQMKEEMFHTAHLQAQEKEQYTKALVLLSELYSNNSTKLDDIRHRIVSCSEQYRVSSTDPMKWLLSIQLSTIEDLTNANRELQEKANIFMNEFEQLLNNGILSYLNNTRGVTDANMTQGVQNKSMDISLANKTSQNVTQITQIDSAKQRPERASAPPRNEQMTTNTNTQELENYVSTYPSKGYLGQLYSHPSDELNTKQNMGLEDLCTAPHTTNTLNQETLEEHKDQSSSKNIHDHNVLKTELSEKISPQLPAQRKRVSPTPTIPDSFTLNPHVHQNQFPLGENSQAQRTPHQQSQQVPVQKFEMTGSVQSSNNLHQILFGNANESSIEVENKGSKVNSIPIIGDMDVVSNHTSGNKESALSGSYCSLPSQKYLHLARINANMLSNLQETIAQHLKENEKSDAHKRLKKISSNIQQYKGIKEKLSDSQRRSARPNNNTAIVKNKTVGLATPSKIIKIPSSSVTDRGSTLDEKNSNMPDSLRDFPSGRSAPNQTRAHIDYTRIFRKPAGYPQTAERDINVNIRSLLSEKKRVLESPEVLNYNERFDMCSPYHPVNSRHALEGIKLMTNIKGKEIQRVRSVDKNVNW